MEFNKFWILKYVDLRKRKNYCEIVDNFNSRTLKY